MRPFAVLLVLLLAGCAFVRVDVAPRAGEIEEQVIEGKGRAKIALLDLSGVITLGPFGLDRFRPGPPLVARFKEELRRVEEDDAVVGAVVRIDTPGGSVTASDILYHELRTLREKRRIPVVACIMDRGLSGGYYAALAADEIVAHPTALVGAVGVVSFKVTVEELLRKWGIEVGTVKSGPLKDFWSPLRPSTAGETALMQELTDRLHRRFLGLVAESRKLQPEALAEVATGRVFDADEAKRLGLLDRVGYLEEAVARARELAGVSEARLILYRRPQEFAGNLYAGGAAPRAEALLLEGAAELLFPSFRYQMLP
jgi:protease-4